MVSGVRFQLWSSRFLTRRILRSEALERLTSLNRPVNSTRNLKPETVKAK
jgi:hypothetical protein